MHVGRRDKASALPPVECNCAEATCPNGIHRERGAPGRAHLEHIDHAVAALLVCVRVAARKGSWCRNESRSCMLAANRVHGTHVRPQRLEWHGACKPRAHRPRGNVRAGLSSDQLHGHSVLRLGRDGAIAGRAAAAPLFITHLNAPLHDGMLALAPRRPEPGLTWSGDAHKWGVTLGGGTCGWRARQQISPPRHACGSQLNCGARGCAAVVKMMHGAQSQARALRRVAQRGQVDLGLVVLRSAGQERTLQRRDRASGERDPR